MTLIRRPHTLRTLKIDESIKQWPTALITILMDRRSFVWLLLGTLLVIVSQHTAPSVWSSNNIGLLSSTTMKSGNTGSMPSGDDSGSNPEHDQPKSSSVVEQLLDTKESKKEIIRVNSTKHKYPNPDSGRWMERYPFLPAVDDVADKDRICFVHVGKTAGSTMACYLGFQYPACNDRMLLLPGKLPQWTTNLMHTHYDNCQYEHINLFLFTLRDPVSRMQSWFRYEYPFTDKVHDYPYKRVLFIDCDFKSLEELAGPRGLGGMGKDVCSRRAWWAIRGTAGFKNHNMYNFAYYYNRTNIQDPNARIAAIRTEYMEQDWINAEKRLFGTSPSSSAFQSGFRHKNKSPAKAANSTDLKAASALANLCSALCEEIQVYKEILHRAENFLPDEIAQSMEELSSKCPTEAQLTHCPALKGRLKEQPEGRIYSYAKHPYVKERVEKP